MKPRLLVILAAVLLVPCIIATVAWVDAVLSRPQYTPVTAQELSLAQLPTAAQRVEDLPESARRWEGRRVSLYGYAYEDPWSKPAQGCYLVLRTSEHIPPSPTNFVRLRMPSGQPTPTSVGLTADGTLHVAMERDPAGRILSVYRLDADHLCLSGASPPPTPRTATPLWLWLILACLVALVILCLRRQSLALRHSDRRLAGLCVHCGYDLRASRDRCPECGTPISMRAPP